MQRWHRFIVLGLVEITSDWISQFILISELSNGELAAMSSALVGHARFIDCQFAVLLVNQEHIAMQAGVFRRAGSNILRNDLTLIHVTAGNIDDQPMLKLEWYMECYNS